MLQLAKEKEHYLSAIGLLAEQRGAADPAWLARLRGEAAARFAELDFPTTRDEEWKYTSVAQILKVPFRPAFVEGGERTRARCVDRFLFEEARHSRLVFINGLFARELSDLSALPPGVVAGNLAEVPAAAAEVARRHLAAHADYRREAFTALNTASLVDAAFVYVPDGKSVEAPIHVLFVSSAGGAKIVSHPRTLVVAGRGAAVTVIESYGGCEESVYFTNAVTEVVAGEGAAVNHYRLQEESGHGFHVAATEVRQARASNYSSCAISTGGALARHTLKVALGGEHGECTIDGLYVVTDRQHVDNHTTIDHAVPRCASRQLYKGILDGDARAVFNGKVFVREGALLTDARQMNRNLLLSDEARVDTKPQLEIFADDVKCAHGATVGQLEDEELFYLASRGLAPERARALLTYGFAEDVIGRIRVPSVRRQLDKVVLTRLHQNLEVS